MVVITHDRWFLDAVVHARRGRSPTATVHQYEGGYAAYVLARAERDRQAATREEKRQQLDAQGAGVAAARAAGADVEAEVPDRGRQRADRGRAGRARHRRAAADSPARGWATRCSTRRTSWSSYGDRPVLRHVTWRLGPGDRVALVGVNGSGKTTLVEAA